MELDLQDVLGRGDFVGGIDNEALDFSQLEAFINSDGPQSGGTYFTDSLNSTTPSTATGKLLNVVVENKRQPGHSLPESPPDSSSEHPYSPQDNCEPPISGPDAIYTTLGQPIYKANLLNSQIINDSLILGPHIVVSDPSEANLLHDNRILVGDADTLLHTHPNYLVQSSGEGATFIQESKKPDGLVHLDFDAGCNVQMVPSDGGLESVPSVYTNLQNAAKKRKLSQDLPPVKSEPAKADSVDQCSQGQLSPPGNLSASMDEDYAASEGCLSESQYQCIRFSAFQQTAWHSLCDQNLTELPVPHYRVDADKGFNFSNADDAFVCQKKNHFQITCHIQLVGDAQFVKTPEGFQKISSFHIHFYGVKHDCPTQTIRVEQSQSDRSKKPFHPVLVELVSTQVTKITVGRLHFSETTSNNMRKKGKPNPEQRYFQLVVGLHAHTSHGNFPIVSHASQKIIVRASNPGQFENDVELCWQKGLSPESIYHAGKVGINTDRPDESLVIHGNLKITGHIIQPSDIRAKKNIVECDTREQLRNVQQLRVVRYQYEPAFATQLNRTGVTSDTGVIAQEVAQVLPEAVTPAGDFLLRNGTSIDNFLVVNKERIFMENIGAVKELCKVTDNLETRIDQLERINRRLTKLKRGDSFKSTSTVGSVNKHLHSAKCIKNHHYCQNEEELCTNKFIQIVIVILVFIMAFCLAAITGLYLMEASRHSHTFSQMSSMQTSHRVPAIKQPTKSTKLHNWSNAYQSNGNDKDAGDTSRSTLDNSSLIKGPWPIIGRPNACATSDSNSDPCPMFCCNPPSPLESPEELDTSIYNERAPKTNHNHTNHLSLDKNKAVKPFHSNDLDKRLRQRRDADDWSKQDNIFHPLEENMLTIALQGKHFNVTLTNKYIMNSNNGNGNISYVIPISKFMPDRYINLIFKSMQPNVKEIEHCYNEYRQQDCPLHSDERYKVNENLPNVQASSQIVFFEVDMIGFRSKVMTYRASLRQTPNTCKLSTTKLGLEFIEYNFQFIRHCDE